MLNPSQHQFCVDGYISATGEPLQACSYIDRNNLQDYRLIPLGRSNLIQPWIRVPPNGRITSERGDDLRGYDSIDVQYIGGENIYFSRTNMCRYMRECYRHDSGWNYNSCQEYWNTPVNCEVWKNFYEEVNLELWLFVYVIALLITLIVTIASLCILRYSIV